MIYEVERVWVLWKTLMVLAHLHIRWFRGVVHVENMHRTLASGEPDAGFSVRCMYGNHGCAGRWKGFAPDAGSCVRCEHCALDFSAIIHRTLGCVRSRCTERFQCGFSHSESSLHTTGCWVCAFGARVVLCTGASSDHLTVGAISSDHWDPKVSIRIWWTCSAHPSTGR
jgi:hypothetical protein